MFEIQKLHNVKLKEMLNGGRQDKYLEGSSQGLLQGIIMTSAQKHSGKLYKNLSRQVVT
jgi:hypothetical protein